VHRNSVHLSKYTIFINQFQATQFDSELSSSWKKSTQSQLKLRLELNWSFSTQLSSNLMTDLVKIVVSSLHHSTYKLTDFYRYFQFKFILKINWFQDDDFWRNNSIKIALCKIKIIWSSIEELNLIVFLSMSFWWFQSNSSHVSESYEILRDEFISWLCRVFLSFMSERKLWQEFRNRRRMNSKERYFRFDIKFDDEELNLNNMSKMQKLWAQAQIEFSKFSELNDLTRCMITSLFYFELKLTSTYIDEKISDVDNILCRLHANNLALEVLISQLFKCLTRFLFEDFMLLSIIENCSFMNRDENFWKRVKFSVSDRQHKILLFLKKESCSSKNVSDFSFFVNSLIVTQNMNADFNQVYHKKRRQLDDFNSSKDKWWWIARQSDLKF